MLIIISLRSYKTKRHTIIHDKYNKKLSHFYYECVTNLCLLLTDLDNHTCQCHQNYTKHC